MKHIDNEPKKKDNIITKSLLGDEIKKILSEYYETRQEPIDLVKAISAINNNILNRNESNNKDFSILLNIIMQEIIGLNTEINCKNDRLVESSTKRVIAESMLSYLNRIEREIIDNSRSKLRLHQKINVMLDKYLMTNYFKKIILVITDDDIIENVYGDDYTLSSFIYDITSEFAEDDKELEKLIMIYQNIINNADLTDFKILHRKFIENDKGFKNLLLDFWKKLHDIVGIKGCNEVIENLYSYNKNKISYNNNVLKPVLKELIISKNYVDEDFKIISIDGELFFGASIFTLREYDVFLLEKFISKLLNSGFNEEAKIVYDYLLSTSKGIKKDTILNLIKGVDKDLLKDFEKISCQMNNRICAGHILLSEPTKDIFGEEGELNFVVKMVMKSIFFMSEILLINEHEFQEFQKETLEALKQISKLRDLETANHMKRVTIYTQILADELLKLKNNNRLEKIIKNNSIEVETDYYTIEKEYIRDLLYSAALHDLGKVGIHDNILKSRKKLTKKQYEIMKLHSIYGYQRLSSITKLNKKKSFLELASILAGNHHEKWDGTGYPNCKKQFEIPLSSRILAIADVYDALRVKRPYKDAYSHEEAVDIIINNKNIYFDPVLTDIFYKINKKFAKAFDENTDFTT